MIKAIIFDLDGVLVDSADIHFNALNQALEHYGFLPLDRREHDERYGTLPTREKLKIMESRGLIHPDMAGGIFGKKQRLTAQFMEEVRPDPEKVQMIAQLKARGYSLAVASNATRSNITKLLNAVGLADQFDSILSSEDVVNPKPDPDIYTSTMYCLTADPIETLIVEDSPMGKMAAVRSGAWLCEVRNPKDVTLARILKQIDIHNGKKLPDDLQIVVPMAGKGSRFVEREYSFPKPLIDVNGKPMIQAVVESLNLPGNYYFIVQDEHYTKYNLNDLVQTFANPSKCLILGGVTDGAARTVLTAAYNFDDTKPLIIVNSDQLIDFDVAKFFEKIDLYDAAGAMLTFQASHPKWSYAKLGEDGYVTEVAEKRVISSHATAGLYYWRKAGDFVKYAYRMIEKGIRVNNEFYVAPVYNQAIENGLKVITFEVDRMVGLGDPESLEAYLRDNHST